MEEIINTIQLGDCYDLIKKIPDKSIDLVYIDIPYLIGTGGMGDTPLSQRMVKEYHQLGVENAYKNIEKKIQEYNEKMLKATTQSEYEKWRVNKNNIVKMLNLKSANIVNGINYEILDEFVRVLKYIYIYIWCSKEQILDLMKYFIDKHNCNFNILVWCKTNSVPATNNNWLPNVEYCLVFKGKGTPRYNDDYELKSKWYVSTTNKTDKDLYNHPTIKPLDLVKRHILHSTQPNDIVLDCFCGSGTTCVACKETGRRYIGMEIDPKYHKIAVDRLNGINANGQMSIFTDFDKVKEE